MTIDFAAINWWAVLVAAVATFLIGGLWYTALFGQRWAQLNGYSEEKLKAMRAQLPPPLFFGGLLACYFLIAVVVALLVVAFQINSVPSGALLGLLLWLGPTAAVAFTGHLASDKPLGAYVLDASYQLIYLVLIGAILGGWR
jgi:hypothetical protein